MFTRFCLVRISFFRKCGKFVNSVKIVNNKLIAFDQKLENRTTNRLDDFGSSNTLIFSAFGNSISSSTKTLANSLATTTSVSSRPGRTPPSVSMPSGKRCSLSILRSHPLSKRLRSAQRRSQTGSLRTKTYSNRWA